MTNNKLDFDWEAEKKLLEATGKYKEFEDNPEIHQELEVSLKKAEYIPEHPANIEKINKVNEYILDIDKKSLNMDTENLANFLKQELDNLTANRVKGFYDEILEDKIVLISMKYYKIVGAPSR